MGEKFIYNNGINEELDVTKPIINNEQTKNDLFILKMLTKLNGEGFTYEEVIGLNDKYFEELGPIISALDYDGITNNEAFEMVNKIENIKEIDKLLIRFLLIYYYNISK